MTAEQFAYWLNGFIELNGQVPNEDQWQSIKEHLSTVFIKITPKMPPFNPPVYAPGPVAPLDGCRPIPSWPNRDIAIC